ncbi:MAG: HlyD family secretion protein [Chitinispirillaceae bacterium]|nr:HlyD family secretion protein [Chitinispirillaceae bacterium]
MKRFYIIYLLIAIILGVITIYFRGEPTKFYGIADTKELIINADAAVEIKRIFVVEGQTVKAGDTLVVLDRPDLTLRINEISHTLHEYKARKIFESSYSESELKKLRAEQEEKAKEISAKIKELEAQYEMNKKLLSELRSIKKEDNTPVDSNSNPILAQIKSLKQLLETVRDPSRIQTVEKINRQHTTSEDPVAAQVQRLSNELALLQREKEKLLILAQIDGVIGSVKFKEGERVSPFDTILTLHSAAPSYVKGFIHENVYSHVSIGDTVEVRSFTDAKVKYIGKIVGVGSRIVDYPIRLRKRQDIPIWGREVVVKIPEDNSFLLGEKVLISVIKKKTNFFKLINNNVVQEVNASEHISSSLSSKSSFSDIKNLTGSEKFTNVPVEASGICYLSDIKSYLLISDETERREPWLFLTNEIGNIYSMTLVKGLPAIDDMEGITIDNRGNIYLLSSQSFTKKGKISDERKVLARVKRNILSFDLDRMIKLTDLLREAAEVKPQSKEGQFILSALQNKTIDIEGICYYKDTLLLGFKNPKLNNRAIIVALINIEEILTTNKIKPQNLSIWRELTLIDTSTATFCGISDLTYYDDKLFGLSTGVRSKSGIEEDVGLIWVYYPTKDTLNIIHSFSNLKPEGITVNTDKNELFIVFDNGSKFPSQFATEKVLKCLKKEEKF